MYANCKLPYWRLKKGYADIFFEFLFTEGPQDLEDIRISNENLKERIKAKREGRKNHNYLFRYRPRICS